MSYERQRTVKDGDEITERDDIGGNEATKGTLTHGVGQRDNKAAPNQISHEGEQITRDLEVIGLLRKILKELKLLNLHQAIMNESDLTSDDIGDE